MAINVTFTEGEKVKRLTTPVYTADYGQEMIVEGLDISVSTVDVDFAIDGQDSITSVGSVTDGVLTVSVPDDMYSYSLPLDYVFHAYIYVVDSSSGTTVNEVIVPVKNRAARTEVEPTPTEQSTIDTLIASINTAVTAAETAQEAAETAAEEAEQDYTEVNEKLVRKTDGLVQTTATDSVVTFVPDSTMELPIHSVVAEIEPVQDLNGYSYPWPAGGGTNIADVADKASATVNGITSYITDTLVTVSGTSTGNGDCNIFLNTQISVASGESITVSTSGSLSVTGGGYTFFLHSPDDGYFMNSAVSTVGDSRTFTMTADRVIDFVLIRFPRDRTPSGSFYLQIEKGTSATSYVPYSNICPISGFTGMTISRTGVNLLEELKSSYTGSVTAYFKDLCVNKGDFNSITLEVGRTYTFSANITSSAEPFNMSVGTGSGRYQRDIANVTGLTSGRVSITFTPTEYDLAVGNIFAVRPVRYSSSTTFTYTVTDMMLEVSDSVSTHSDYSAEEYDVDWSSEAGTVYGGTLDVTTGVLTVTHVTDVVSNLTVSTAFTTGTKTCMVRYSLSNTSTTVAYSTKHRAISNMGVEATAYYGTIRVNDSGSTSVDFAITPDGTLLSVYDSDLTLTAETFATKYANMQVCYPLATPVTYQLTPIDITSVSGETNTVWCDTGDVTVTYSEDLLTAYNRLATAIVALGGTLA